MSFRSAIIILTVSLLWSCAQQGSPSGGPRDEDPPVVLESIPPNYSTRFEAKKITLTFDEYVVLDNVNQELIVSPPMEEKPQVKLRGKKLIIDFEEDLKDSTTYTFNFGSAIKDLHEGNILLNYEYVFSTGDRLDSLSVKGILQYAENLTRPSEPVTIMLYEDLNDSVPLKDIPLYVGRSDDSGVFSVNNLKADTFKVFALKDGNYNLLYDLPTEEIAYLDSSLWVDATFINSLMDARPFDSTFATADTSGMPTDSLQGGPDYNSIYIDLLLFLEDVETQYLKEDQRDDRRKILFSFARPLTDSFSYRFLGMDGERTPDVLEVFSARKDSLTLWLKDSLDYKNDSLFIALNYTAKDTIDRFVTRTDTMLMTFREKSDKKKKEKEPEAEKLSISTIRAKGTLDLNTHLRMEFNVPLETFADTLIRLWQIPDSVELEIPFRTRVDSMVPTWGWIETDWESNSSYHLQMLPGAAKAIYELEQDTLDLVFQTRDMEYYGKILLSLEGVSGPVIIQLTSKEKVVREEKVNEDGLCTFPYLLPGDYGIKIIHDRNNNGRWDTGKYLEKRQPEPVEILNKSVTVRSNWDHEVSMILKK